MHARIIIAQKNHGMGTGLITQFRTHMHAPRLYAVRRTRVENELLGTRCAIACVRRYLRVRVCKIRRPNSYSVLVVRCGFALCACLAMEGAIPASHSPRLSTVSGPFQMRTCVDDLRNLGDFGHLIMCSSSSNNDNSCNNSSNYILSGAHDTTL